MKQVASLMRRLIAARDGSTVVEFAALGPLFILMMLTVFQFAAASQAYNALAGAAADVQRQVVVQSQAGNNLTTTQMQAGAIAVASSQPYFLKATNLSVNVAKASTQRVSGATEYQLTMAYAVPVIVFPTSKTFAFTYKRAIFVKSLSN